MFWGKKKTVVASNVTNENDQTNSLVRRVEATQKMLVWKYEEEKIGPGSTVIVHPSQRVVFIKNGELIGTLEAGEHLLDPDALPFLQRLLLTAAGRPPYLHAQIYYVNETFQMGINWGCGNIRFMDPISNIPLTIGAFGEMAVQIDPERAADFVIDLVGTAGTLDQETLMQYFRSKITMIVRSTIAQAIKELGINIFEISSYLMDLSEQLVPKIRASLGKYGVLVKEFIVEDVKLPEGVNAEKLEGSYAADYFVTQDAMRHRKEVMLEAGTKADLAKMEALGEVEVEKIRAAGKADVAKTQAMGEADITRIKADAKAYERNAENYTWREEMDLRMEEKRLGADLLKAEFQSRNPNQGMPFLMPQGVDQNNVQYGYYMHAGNGMPQGQERWICSCGTQNTGRFCSNCGGAKPEGWVCACGAKNSGKFCSNCGATRMDTPWVCSCGTRNSGRFCSNCGKNRG